ncbi:MAG: hypothetical protein EBS86_16690, partial [Crocinitomicaceae bacterium]|nr:hypothetical protein [Crocinitomicaceae bacterium]
MSISEHQRTPPNRSKAQNKAQIITNQHLIQLAHNLTSLPARIAILKLGSLNFIAMIANYFKYLLGIQSPNKSFDQLIYAFKINGTVIEMSRT